MRPTCSGILRNLAGNAQLQYCMMQASALSVHVLGELACLTLWAKFSHSVIYHHSFEASGMMCLYISSKSDVIFNLKQIPRHEASCSFTGKL